MKNNRILESITTNQFFHWLRYAISPLHVKEILDQYDGWKGVIAYNYPGLALMRLRSLCHARQIRIYADCTEWYLPDFHTLHRVAATLDSCLRMRWALKRVDGLIAISSFLANYYKPYTKVVLLPPMVDLEESKWVSANKAEPHDRLKLFYVGAPGLYFVKDRLDLIIKAIAAVSHPEQFEVHIVGIDKEQILVVFPELEPLITRLFATKTLLFHGRLPHHEALALLKTADFSIFLRERNRMTTAGFTTKFVESISCGVPVITTDTSDLRIYATDNRNAILLPPDNFSKDLVELLETLSTGKHPLPKVERYLFDYRNYTRGLQAFLQDLFSPPKG